MRKRPCVCDRGASQRHRHHNVHRAHSIGAQSRAVAAEPRARVGDGHKVERKVGRYAVRDGANVDVREHRVDSKEYEERREAIRGVCPGLEGFEVEERGARLHGRDASFQELCHRNVSG